MTPPTPTALLQAVTEARYDLARIREGRMAGTHGYADLASAQYRLQLALQRADDAGLFAPTCRTSRVMVTVPLAGSRHGR